MMARRPSPLALAVLDYFVANNDPLKGDLIEEFQLRESQVWLWRQVVGAVLLQHRGATLHPRRRIETIVLGIVVLALLSFEAVLVVNVMQRLIFGPPMPNISGYLYLFNNASDSKAVPVAQPVAQFSSIVLALLVSIPSGWLIARVHRHHHALAIGGFMVSVMLCALINIQAAFTAQFLTTAMFILGLFAGGRMVSAVDEPSTPV